MSNYKMFSNTKQKFSLPEFPAFLFIPTKNNKTKTKQKKAEEEKKKGKKPHIPPKSTKKPTSNLIHQFEKIANGSDSSPSDTDFLLLIQK